MKSKKILFKGIIFILMAALFMPSCEDPEDPTPTNELMEGVWEVSAIYDEDNVGILDSITLFFPVFFHLDDVNSVNSTAGPLFMYIVYGGSRFINVVSKFDDIFKYVDFQLTEGEWFIDKNKVVDNFTVEIKMRFPTMETLDEVFQLLNLDLPEIVEDAIDIVIYHKFKFVSIDIGDENPDVMVWEFTDAVVPTYNTKDQYGDPVLYTGISVNEFSRCRIVFQKKVKSILDLVGEAAGKKAIEGN